MLMTLHVLVEVDSNFYLMRNHFLDVRELQGILQIHLAGATLILVSNMLMSVRQSELLLPTSNQQAKTTRHKPGGRAAEDSQMTLSWF